MKNTITLLFTLFLLPAFASGNDKNAVHFENYSAYYTVFNSTFIKPDVAATYGIKRSKYESLLNLSISEKGKYGGVAAALKGTVTDLMQQQKALEFKEINEDGTVYYLAPVRIAGEDLVRFKIDISLPDESKPLIVEFQQKIYAD